MTVDYNRLINYSPDPITQEYGFKDTILYSLGIGVGYDPLDQKQLPFVYERKLQAMPTMVCVLGYQRVADMDLGIDYTKILHGDQRTVFHKPLAGTGRVKSQVRISSVIDRGDKGSLIYIDREVSDAETGELLATTTMGVIARADGNFGGPSGSPPVPHQIPEREPDMVVELPTMPQQALIYRLCADYNALHADPAVAAKAGFDRPILHGLATYGLVGHAILRGVCGYDPVKLRSLSGRFTAPVFPGETIRTEIWKDGNVVSYRARSVERDAIVMNNGHAEVS